MKEVITLKIDAKVSKRDVLTSILMIPIEDRLPMVEKIIKPQSVSDYKHYLNISMKFLLENELSIDDIVILESKINEFKTGLKLKGKQKLKEYDK